MGQEAHFTCIFAHWHFVDFASLRTKKTTKKTTKKWSNSTTKTCSPKCCSKSPFWDPFGVDLGHLGAPRPPQDPPKATQERQKVGKTCVQKKHQKKDMSPLSGNQNHSGPWGQTNQRENWLVQLYLSIHPSIKIVLGRPNQCWRPKNDQKSTKKTTKNRPRSTKNPTVEDQKTTKNRPKID